jgi:hypothetical protein
MVQLIRLANQNFIPMSPKEQLQIMLNQRYFDEDNKPYRVELKRGLNEEALDRFTAQFPSHKLPADIKELLQYASGFYFSGIDEITFDRSSEFGLDNLFPWSVQLADDGFGNSWILDVDKQGNWGAVFYVSHDPAVVVKHSNNLTEFLQHIDEYGKKGSASHLGVILEETAQEIWKNNSGFIAPEIAKQSGDESLTGFASQLADNYVIIDLRNRPNGTGFAWGKYNQGVENAKRYKGELLWAIEKEPGRGIFGKLFSR